MDCADRVMNSGIVREWFLGWFFRPQNAPDSRNGGSRVGRADSLVTRGQALKRVLTDCQHSRNSDALLCDGILLPPFFCRLRAFPSRTKCFGWFAKEKLLPS